MLSGKRKVLRQRACLSQKEQKQNKREKKQNESEKKSSDLIEISFLLQTHLSNHGSEETQNR